jgi:hypothetical protein
MDLERKNKKTGQPDSPLKDTSFAEDYSSSFDLPIEGVASSVRRGLDFTGRTGVYDESSCR